MISENDYILSFYEALSDFGEKENVQLVKNTATGQLYVKKTLSVYDRAVFDFIRRKSPPNVPKIVELLQEGDELIVIEEYYSGRSVRDLLDERGILSITEALPIIRTLVDILIPFHSEHPPIVHRDIKPENLLLSSDGVIKLVDFNAAKIATPEKSRDTELFGTVGYAAPEQYGFGTSSPATDIYAIGMLITELTTGTLDPKAVPEPLAGIADKCTRLDPTDRYQTVLELKADLTVLGTKNGRLTGNFPAPSAVHVTGWRSFLPPGFRTGVWWKMLLAAIGYGVILFLTYAGGYAMNTTAGRLLEYIFAFVPSVGTVLIWFNYKGIWRFLPLLRSEKPILRILGLILYPALLLAIVLFSLILFCDLTGIDMSSRGTGG